LKKDGQWEWVNLYGAAIKGVKQKGDKAMLMNKFSDHASTYRGKVLINMRAVLRPPPDVNNVPFRRFLEVGALSSLPTPKMSLYTLRAFLVQGCEIPIFNKLLPDLEEGSTIARMKVCDFIHCP
jgi:hypothetical protein